MIKRLMIRFLNDNDLLRFKATVILVLLVIGGKVLWQIEIMTSTFLS